MKLLAILLILPFSSLLAEEGNFRISNRDFKHLFNEFRVAQPQNPPWAGSYWPYGANGIAAKIHSRTPNSPAAKFDVIFGQGSKATDWENENHSCESVAAEHKQGCRDWWGHCNAWAAAAIKDAEPRSVLNSPEGGLTVGDQKAALTELWMASGSLFAGDTQKEAPTGDWVYEPKSATARKRDESSGMTYYESFWDVSPKSFFLIFTNYVGILKVGLVIDRFAGDQVWNQPISGYRILPLRAQDIKPKETREGVDIYPVLVRMKIYWADDGVESDHLASRFDINALSDSELVDSKWRDYTGRLLKFTLFFDAPVTISSDGLKVESAGKIVHSIWDHQQFPVDNPDETHPDFIWLPTDLHQRSYGDRNPHIAPQKIYGVFKGGAGDNSGGGESAGEEPGEQKISFSVSFESLLGASRAEDLVAAARAKIRRIFGREGLDVGISSRDITVKRDRVSFSLSLPNGVTKAKAESILTDSGLTLL